MNVAIHVEFMRALGKLSAQDRKVTEDMMLRIQSGGITPGMRRHQIVADHKAFTSLSPSMDQRVPAIEESSCNTWRCRDSVFHGLLDFCNGPSPSA